MSSVLILLPIATQHQLLLFFVLWFALVRIIIDYSELTFVVFFIIFDHANTCIGWSKNTTNITLIVSGRPETKCHQLEGERSGFVCAVCLFLRFGWFCKIGDPVPSVTGVACCFRWVSRLRTYRDGTAVGNVTNVVCVSTPCSQRFV